MSKEILKRVQLLMNYNVEKTLNENLDLLKNKLDEANIAGEEIGALKGALEDAFKSTKELSQVEILNAEGAIIKPNNVDELIDALERGRLTPNTLGQVNTGLLKSARTPENAIDVIINSPTFDKKFAERYGSLLNDEPRLRAQLRSKNFTPESIEKMIARAKGEKFTAKVGGDVKASETATQNVNNNGNNNVTNQAGGNITNNTTIKNYNGLSPEVKPYLENVAQPVEEINKLKTVVKDNPAAASAVENAGQKIGYYGAQTWDKLKVLKSKMSLKQLLLYGLAGYGAYTLIKNLWGDKKTNGILPACIANLPDAQFKIGGDQVVVAVLPDGVDSTSNGHGGLQFWPTGRVISNDGIVRGNYYCKGTSGGKQKVGLSEQVDSSGKYDNIHIDWDGLSTSVPIETGGGNNGGSKTMYHDCTQKDFPFEFGCINPKIGELQQCMGVSPTKGYFGPKTQGALKSKGYDPKTITQEIYDTIMSTCGNSQTAPQLNSNGTGFVDPSANMPKYNAAGRLKSIQDKAGQMMPNVDPTNTTSNVNTPTGKPPVSSNTQSLTSPSSTQSTDGTLFQTLKNEGSIKGTPNVDKVIYYTGKTPLSDSQQFEMNSVLSGFGYVPSKRYKGKWNKVGVSSAGFTPSKRNKVGVSSAGFTPNK